MGRGYEIFLKTFLISLCLLFFVGDQAWFSLLLLLALVLVFQDWPLGEQARRLAFYLLPAAGLAWLALQTGGAALPAEELWNRQEDLTFQLVKWEPGDPERKGKKARMDRLTIRVSAQDLGHPWHRPYLFEGRSQDFSEEDLGRTFQAQVHFQPYAASSLPGQFDARSYKNGQGLTGEVDIQGARPLAGWRNPLPVLRFRFKQRLESRFATLPEPAASFLKRIVLGSAMPLDEDMKAQMKDLGLSHLLAASGLHVGLLYHWGIQVLSHLVESRKEADRITLTLIFLYAWLLDFPASIARALTFLCFRQLAMHRKKELHPFRRFLFALAFYLLLHPYAIQDLGLRLSYLCALALDQLAFWQKRRPVQHEGLKSLRASAWISLYTLPLLASIEPVFRPVIFLANLTAIPFFTLFFRLGLVTLLLQPIPFLASTSAWVLQLFYQAFTFLLQGLQVLAPQALSIQRLASPPGAALYYGLLFLWTEGRKWRPHRSLTLQRRISFPCIFLPRFERAGLQAIDRQLIILSLASSLLFTIQATLAPPRLTMVDVGQGDCFLLQSGSQAALVDTGGKMNFATGENSQAIFLARALQDLGVRQLDAVFLSHKDYDHMGNLQGLGQVLPIASVYTSPWTDHRVMAEALGPLTDRVQPVAAGNVYALDGGKIRCAVLDAGRFDAQDKNSEGMTLLVTLDGGKNISILFMGDKEKGEEGTADKAIQQAGAAGIDVLKLAHHGSKNASSAAFLDRVQAPYALVSAGLGNRYGHPSLGVLARLEARGMVVLRSDFSGTMTLEARPQGLAIYSQREAEVAQLLFWQELTLLVAWNLRWALELSVEIQRPTLGSHR